MRSRRLIFPYCFRKLPQRGKAEKMFLTDFSALLIF
jgi:hypothetical protein